MLRRERSLGKVRGRRAEDAPCVHSACWCDKPFTIQKYISALAFAGVAK